MTIRNLEHAFEARSVALIGATPRPGSVGSKVLGNLTGAGFKGPIWPVNPGRDSIDGLRCYASVADLPEAPDFAVIATPPATVPQLIGELGARGTRAALVLTAGISEKSGLRQAMLDAAQPWCLRIIGPNSFGLFAPALGLNASFAHLAPAPGHLAFLSQSGALASAVLDWSAERDIGFSTVVSLGDMADVDVGDLLDLLAGERQTRAILMYLETVPDARKFMSAARAAARVKPVIVIKSGRHAAGAEAAATHTGALAGADGVMDAAFRRAGLLRVIELPELFDAAETLSRFRPIERGRLGIVTNGGGAGVLAVDRHLDFDGELAALAPETIAALESRLPANWSRANPVDIIGDAGPERYTAAAEAVLADPNVDALLVMSCPTALASPDEAADALIAVVEGERGPHGRNKPVLTSWLGDHSVQNARQRMRKAGIATYDSPGDAVRSLSYLVGYSKAQNALSRTPPELPDSFSTDAAAARKAMAQAASEDRSLLSEPEAKAVLAAFGVPVAETVVADSVESVEAIAADLLTRNGALAVKIVSRDITHKSDVGGVVLNLASPDAALQAARDIARRAGEARPDARIDGFAVQAMIDRPDAHELIVGIDDDALFGPTILFGAGGTSVEVVADSAIALPPLDLQLADDLIGRTRIARLLAGYRSRPPADMDALRLALVRVSQLIIDCPEVVGLDINPLLADSAGVMALDARLVIDPVRFGAAAPNPRLAIRPYPSRWERRLTTRGGLDVHLRPIRPPDERLYAEFLDKLEDRDIRLRLLAPRKAFPHDFLARLTQIDYAREMAFVAIDATTGALLGVARLAADPDYTRAEYAIVVRSDLQGRGLGWSLMEHLLAYARAEGLGKIDGFVLAENTEMLSMVRQLGFSVSSEPGEPGLTRVEISLGDGR
jgi:acetyltransferase